jgi:hypothetical protein
MKKILITMAMMSAMAMAQTSSGTGTDQSSSSGTGSSSASQSGDTQSTQEPSTHKDHKSAQSEASAKPESDKSAGKTKTLTGCLHKDGDNMWLKTKTSKYHVMSSQDISAHDGHEVKVSGTVSKAPLPGSSDKKSVNHIEATSVDMVAEKCSMGESSMKMKGDELSKQGDETKSKPKM